MKKTQLSRRRFLQTTALTAVAAPTIVPGSVLGRAEVAPSNRITVGLTGSGSRGTGVMHSFLREADAQVIATCDPYETHDGGGRNRKLGRKPAAEAVGKNYGGKPCDTHSDFRELCARKDLDVVIVGTPDHWHALQTLEALRNGKDVYCEKPVTHLFAEGVAVYKEAEKQKAIFQTGSQQRSDRRFHHAVELVLNGVIGKVKTVEVGLPRGHDKDNNDSTPHDYSKRADYQQWTGPAPMLPYVAARHHWHWRWHLAYGGGQLMDWIGHHNDICHWMLGEDNGGPTRVEAKNFRRSTAKSYDSPTTYEVHCEYAGGIKTSIGSHNRMGVKVTGEDGWVYVTRGRVEASNPAWAKLDFNAGKIKAYNSPGHTRNFLDGVKSRKPAICPAETAHRSITPGHLGYVSNTVGRALKWDAKKEQIIGDKQANALLQKLGLRKPWTLG
ncbi:MAG: Gfo/Idh/MocA family oxidoreductase [Verrucomicrobia subdivision 3 bacterium]|nr:Gfo/Idh/MocA family oxidoreductase [Limisphaerales bacterium]